MRLAVLGATGPTGQQLVLQALERGHQVVAAVRNPDRLGELADRENLTVKTVDIFNEDDLAAAFEGCDAVLSALGAPTSFFRIELMTKAGPVIVAAMRRQSVRRLVAITAACTVYSREHPLLIEWIFKPLVIGRNLDDMARMEEFLVSQCSDIDYTVVKPPGLQNKPLDPRPLLTEEGQFVRNPTSYALPRANVAKFMLDCVDSGDWSRKLVAIQY